MFKFKILFLIFLLFQFVYPQSSGPEYRRNKVMNGNNVKTVFGNWGVIGQPGSAGPRGAWPIETNGYLGD
ncbi:MAG: hypothetical protein KAR38_16355, partial [Calditrichia bacterium]|nr:hypothetical protein [Calditrichia bacterium]